MNETKIALAVPMMRSGAAFAGGQHVQITAEQQVPVVDDATLYGAPLKLVAPPPDGASIASVCVAMGYTVNPDGSVEQFEVLNSWSSRAPGNRQRAKFWEGYAQAAAQAVRIARDGRVATKPPATAVRTISSVAFGPRAEENAHCVVVDAKAAYATADAYRIRMATQVRQGRTVDLEAEMNRNQANRNEMRAPPPAPPPAPAPGKP